jgi:hypothetical protein
LKKINRFNFINLTPFKLVNLFLILLILNNWILNAFGLLGYNFDIHHAMYSGFNLINGEFHWTKEYDDKLPVVQILFVIPAFFESIIVWFLMSSLFILFGAYACYQITYDLISVHTQIPLEKIKFSAVIASILMIYTTLHMPGGIYHINTASSSMAIVSIAMLFKSFPKKSKLRKFFFLSSAFCASLAIGIRPYYFLSLIVVVPLLIYIRSRILTYKINYFKISFFWIFAVGMFGFISNLLIYLILYDISYFFSGISLLSQNLHPQTIIVMLKVMARTFLSLNPILKIIFFVYFGSIIQILFYYIYLRKNFLKSKLYFINFIILLIVAPSLILIMILSKYFLTHYIQMFAPFISIGTGFFLCMNKYNLNKRLSLKNNFGSWAVATSIILISTILQISKDYKNVVRNIDNNYKFDELLLEIKKTALFLNIDQNNFLYINDMNSHWKLKQPRYGLPHAAHSKHIIQKNWWREVKMPDHFNHPINVAEYCEAIEKKGPKIVIVKKLGNFEKICLDNSSKYVFEKKLNSDIKFYIRK